MSRIETKLNEINEKLAELKMSKDVPEYDDLFNTFAWTREWFSAIEEVLLDLAFRDESDRPILEFIRAKIHKIDVQSFNKILAAFGAPPIDNHYDYLISLGTPKCYDSGNFSSNTNDKIVNFLINNPRHINWYYLSKNPNEIAVDFMLKNPDKIVSSGLSQNTNKKALEYLMSDEKHICMEILENPDDTAVDYILANTNMISSPDSMFSRNTNDRAVRYMLDHPEVIEWDQFTFNSNDIAVDYMINNYRNIKFMNKKDFYQNTNPKVSSFLIKNKYLDLNRFCQRSDDIAVDYIFANLIKTEQKILSSTGVYNFLSANTNDRILEYLMNNKHLIDPDFITRNDCNYNMQKLREFNKLRLFPRLPHLIL
jgi:hypothetical protein